MRSMAARHWLLEVADGRSIDGEMGIATPSEFSFGKGLGSSAKSRAWLDWTRCGLRCSGSTPTTATTRWRLREMMARSEETTVMGGRARRCRWCQDGTGHGLAAPPSLEATAGVLLHQEPSQTTTPLLCHRRSRRRPLPVLLCTAATAHSHVDLSAPCQTSRRRKLSTDPIPCSSRSSLFHCRRRPSRAALSHDLFTATRAQPRITLGRAVDLFSDEALRRRL
ncbi:hypothetical protein M0R45_002348 [Rubus argutus]|uniref:Uncharacterized protein n=1 Tax=Rubus argutus TaxID=59490 RepID=A0AAW1VGB4_RUBAR